MKLNNKSTFSDFLLNIDNLILVCYKIRECIFLFIPHFSRFGEDKTQNIKCVSFTPLHSKKLLQVKGEAKTVFSLSLSHLLTCTFTHTHSICLTHSLSLSLALEETHTHTHTHTHTYIYSKSLSLTHTHTLPQYSSFFITFLLHCQMSATPQ